MKLNFGRKSGKTKVLKLYKDQLLSSVNVMERQLIAHAEKNNNKYVHISITKRFKQILMNNILEGRKTLVGSGAVQAHVALSNEIEKVFTVLINSFEAFRKENGSDNIPVLVIKNFIQQLRVRIKMDLTIE